MLKLHVKGVDIRIQFALTPPEIPGFCFRLERGHYFVVVNAELTLPEKLEVIAHEAEHIKLNRNKGKVICLDKDCLRSRDNFDEWDRCFVYELLKIVDKL